MKTKKKGPAPRGVKQALEFVIGLHMGTVPVCTREGLGRKNGSREMTSVVCFIL